MINKIVLAYSGGLDTSVIIPWLKDHIGAEIVAFVADVGQGAGELEGIEEKAHKTGASSCYIVDLKDAFVSEYVYPTVQAGAVYEGKYLLGTSMARPIIARAQVEIARKVGADAVAHGCTGKGNDQVRFEAAFSALAPDLKVIAPWRMWDMKSREDLLAYLDAHNIPCAASREKIYSRDRNLWHISHEGGAIENPWNAPPEDAWQVTADPLTAPDLPANVSVSFKSGVPFAVNGKSLSPAALIETLNMIAAPHGVGRIDIVENRLVGMKSRGLYETPGGTVLVEAIKALEEIVLDRETLHYKEHLALTFAEIVYNGKWFTPLREALQACIDKMTENVTGEVVVSLHKGKATAIQRKSPFSLYSEQYATFEEDEVYDQKHAEGFIRLFSLPERIAAQMKMQGVYGAQEHGQ